MRTHDASPSPSIEIGLLSSCSVRRRSTSPTIVRTCRTLLADTRTNTSMIASTSPTSRITTSKPFFARAASATTLARVRATGWGPVKRRTRSSSPRSVEATSTDLVHHRLGNEPGDGAPRRQPGAEVGGRHVEPRHPDVVYAPALARRVHVEVAGPFHDDNRGQGSRVVEA